MFVANTTWNLMEFWGESSWRRFKVQEKKGKKFFSSFISPFQVIVQVASHHSRSCGWENPRVPFPRNAGKRYPEPDFWDFWDAGPFPYPNLISHVSKGKL